MSWHVLYCIGQKKLARIHLAQIFLHLAQAVFREVLRGNLARKIMAVTYTH